MSGSAEDEAVSFQVPGRLILTEAVKEPQVWSMLSICTRLAVPSGAVMSRKTSPFWRGAPSLSETMALTVSVSPRRGRSGLGIRRM